MGLLRESEMRFTPRFDRLILSTRLALTVGFGGLLVIIALAGLDTLRVLRQIRANEDQIRQEFLFRNHVLNNIRSDLYLSGTYVRDYLLEPDFERAESYRATLQKVRTEMDSALESYGSKLDPEQSRDYAALKIELAGYWDVLEPVLQLNNQERQRKGYAFLRADVFPRRMAMLDIANRIVSINEQQLSAGNQRDAGLLSSFQNRLTLTLFVTVVLGMGMAAFSMRKILKLESHAHTQYEEVVQARRQLVTLSARLIPALQWQAGEVSRRTCMDVTVSTDLVSDDLPDEYKTCIYRVVQEALHNCSAHSQATAVRIKVEQEPERLTLSIRDNGKGFDVKQSKGLGLLGIEERAAHLGGKCQIHSKLGSGTTLAIELPFRAGQSAKIGERDPHPVGG